MKVWDPHTGRKLPELKCNVAVSSTAFSPDGNLFATGSFDQTVQVWDANSGQELRTLKGHTADVRGVAFSPDGNLLASAGRDRTVRVWNVATGKEVLPPLKGHTHWVRHVAFSPDGTRLASAAYDNTVRVWNTRTGKEVLPVLTGHTSAVFGVAFSPDGHRLASCSYDQTVKVWDADTGQELLTLKGHRDEVQSVAFSPNGTRLASASQDGTVLFWDARPWTPAAAVEREAMGLLGHLFAKPLCKEDVVEYVRTLPVITPQARQSAPKLMGRYREEINPERYHQASWAVLRQPYLNPFQYRFALRQAETACRLAPENDQYRTALGVAQYRADQIERALDTLKRVNQRESSTPAVLAFLAMAQYRLALRNEAQATLEQLKQRMQEPTWLMNAEAQGFMREAEALLETAPAAKK